MTVVTCGKERLNDEVLLDLVRVPAGEFMMGSPDDEEGREEDEGPQHLVSVPEFWMGQYPVTQQEWEIVAGWSPVKLELKSHPSKFVGPRQPVEQVSWYEAMEFCQRLSLHTGRYYRLPTESEWEYACRAGTTTPFHFGPTLSDKYSNYRAIEVYGPGKPGEYRKETVSVDHFQVTNDFGLCDMHGNVWEWCLNPWTVEADRIPTQNVVMKDAERTHRIMRGGSWVYNPQKCRSAHRGHNVPSAQFSDLGFRIVLDLSSH